MLKFLKTELNITHTENGALTHASTMSDCLDLFSTIGALRTASDLEITNRFVRAWSENPDLAMKIAFFARDVRGGLGERRIFRVILQTLTQLAPASLLKNIENIPYYGRFDDLLALLDTPCRNTMLAYIKNQLLQDIHALNQGESVSLLAKWMPSINASNLQTVKNAKIIARALGMRDAQYRKTLSALRAKIAILENNLRELDYTFDYAKQPSKAMFKYRKAFQRNDSERYHAFLQDVRNGNATLHTGTLYPYELVTAALQHTLSKAERLTLDTTWNALPKITNDENALVVIDGSGSMYMNTSPSPAAVALSLGIYFAQQNTGTFHNHFITFSHRPQLVHIKGNDLYEQIQYCKSFNECANTDVQAVFTLLLQTAVKHHLKQADLPSTLYFVSDMEFDVCADHADLTNFQLAKKKFARHGYKLPNIIFWNVASRSLQQPVTQNEQGVALVSGCSPRLFDMVLQGNLSPYLYMMQILNDPRYQQVTA